MKKKLLLCLFVSCVSVFLLPARSQAEITVISPENKIYIFTNTVYIIGKTDAKELRFFVNGEEGASVKPTGGNFHFLVNLNNGLNKIEAGSPDLKEKIQLEVFSLKNYKFFVLKTYDSTGPAGFVKYIFHTGKKDALCKECHAMDPMKSDRKMCFSLCHKKDVMKWGYMHGPAGEGACLACHDPEGYNNGYKVVVDGGGQLCMTCHEGIGSMKANVHTAVKKQFCMGCHSPHGTTNDFVLWEDGKANMCYLCHLNKKVRWKKVTDDKGKENFVENGDIPVPHRAISDGDCLGCHHPHESDNPFNLRQPPGKLCVETECHTPIFEKLSKHQHPYDIQHTSGSPVEVSKDIFLDNEGKIVCYSCHNPHGSDYKFIFWKPREMLCPSCHSNMEQIKEETLNK